MSALHVWTDGNDWVIAATAEQARDLWCSTMGIEPRNDANDGSAEDGAWVDWWEQEPDDKIMTIGHECGDGSVEDEEHGGESCPHCKGSGVVRVQKTAAEWATEGPGYLASEDW